jgi:hypothetical protein
MTAHLKQRGAKLASVEAVAWKILDAVEQGTQVAYVPGKWRAIMMIIRHLPISIYSRLNI